MARYLEKELGLIPKETPIIAVGNEAYESLCYGFRNYFIIGVPHTGSRIFDEFENNINLVRSMIKEAKEKGDTCVRVFPKDLACAKSL
jgi:hypothetical protein